MSTIIHTFEALQSGLIEAAAVIGYPAAVMMTAGTVGTGLASVAAIMSYPGSGSIAARSAAPRMGFMARMMAALERSMSRHCAVTELAELDGRMLRDIGLTRADIAALKAPRREMSVRDGRFVFRPDI